VSATAPGFTLFDTEIGRCALAWGAHGIVAVQLPEADDRQTRSRIQRRFAGAREAAPPSELCAVIDGIVALLEGRPSDLSAAPLDLARLTEFDRSVYAVARSIAPGETLTYGQVAARLGDPALARAVGRALGRNPFALVVPCHRVLSTDGRLGGFSASGGATTKRRLLLIEGARTSTEPGLFDPPPAAS